LLAAYGPPRFNRGNQSPAMKTALASLFFFCATASHLLFAENFVKGDKVELIKDTPVYFKDAVLRVGKSGEQFTVLAVQAGTHRVYLSTQDALGKEIAVSTLDSELRKAGAAEVVAPPVVKKELHEATPEQAVYVVETKSGKGSAFLLQMNGACYLVTNAHVVASAPKAEFKNASDTTVISGGFVEVADDRDLVRFPSNSDKGLMLATEVKADENVIAYGNSGGADVVTKLRGEVLGVGVEKIEVSCEFIPGNSGGPILNEKGNVVGIASFLTRNTSMAEWIKTGTRFDKARRFAYRVNDGITWSRIPFKQFVSESTQVEAMRELPEFFGDALTQMLYHSLQSQISNPFPTNQAVANFTKAYNRAATALEKGDGAYFTQAALAKYNAYLKSSARTLTADFVRIIENTAKEQQFKVQGIKTPFFKKQAQDVVAELHEEAKYVTDNAKEIFGSDFLK